MFLKSMGSKRNPLDRLKMDDLEPEDVREDDIQLHHGVDDCMSRFGKSLSKLCQDDGDDILNWASKSEAKRKQAGLFCDINLPKTKTDGSEKIYRQIVRHDY
ncbi:unnamed protein product [Lymnaea stagnalis]|uniref:Uncharacterized protein n=1 Tax=Lymnaea stagnalis TaxID=6523 RepID=A0AAV2HCM3_LYMST